MNSSFTDQLIEEHLKGSKANSETQRKNVPKYVTRDSEEFRRFLRSTYESKDREDPFTHFYLTEARPKENIKRLVEEENTRAANDHLKADTAVLAETEKRREIL